MQLLRRYRLITGGHGCETEVQSEGVVGVQSHIEPNEEYQCTNDAVIETSLGIMQGRHEVIDGQGTAFTIDIPVSRLATLVLIH